MHISEVSNAIYVGEVAEAPKAYSGSRYVKYDKKLVLKYDDKFPKKLRKKLGIPKGSKMDAAHYKGSTTDGRAQHRSKNRQSRKKA